MSIENLGWLFDGVGGSITGGILIIIFGVFARFILTSRRRIDSVNDNALKSHSSRLKIDSSLKSTKWDRLDPEADAILLSVANQAVPPSIDAISQSTTIHAVRVLYYLRHLSEAGYILPYTSASSSVHLTIKGGNYLVESDLI